MKTCRLWFLLLALLMAMPMTISAAYKSDKGGANSNQRIIPGGNDGSNSGEAQRKLGDLYFYGKNVKQDYDKALNCYRKAAEQGCDCYEVLGDLYAIKHDYAEATKWYQKAADNNNDEAQLKLGLCYATGKGVKQSFSEATKLINGWIKGMSLANLAGVMFITLFILLIILFHFALFNGKRLGLSKRIILAFAISASLSITLCLCFSFMISLSDLLPLIASDFFMFYVFFNILHFLLWINYTWFNDSLQSDKTAIHFG